MKCFRMVITRFVFDVCESLIKTSQRMLLAFPEDQLITICTETIKIPDHIIPCLKKTARFYIFFERFRCEDFPGVRYEKIRLNADSLTDIVKAPGDDIISSCQLAGFEDILPYP